VFSVFKWVSVSVVNSDADWKGEENGKDRVEVGGKRLEKRQMFAKEEGSGALRSTYRGQMLFFAPFIDVRSTLLTCVR